MVCGPASVSRLRTIESQLPQIERLYKDINGADWIVLADPVLKLLGKQYALRPILPLDESAHQQLRQPGRTI
jgi:hypothetical protein